jgi:signal transduction histidine kinase
MSLAISYFNGQFLSTNFDRFKNENSNKIIKDSLINENFSGYLNKYDTRIYTFDSSNRALYNEDSASYEVISNIIYQSKRTDIENLYYYESSLDRFSYLFQKEVRDKDHNIIGHFFVVAKPKRYKSDALYPELFKQVRDISADLNVNYAYAVYNKGEILENYGDYNFKSRLSKEDLPHLEFETRWQDDNNELWYNVGNNKIVVIIRKGTLFFEAITLFAYLFGTFLFIVLLFHVGNLLFHSRFQWRNLKPLFKFSIRNQIQSTIIFISVFSFVIIGAATISFYINRFNKSNRERLVKAITIMADEIKNQIATHAIFDDVVKIYDLGANSELESSISEASEIHSVDVNFYDVSGELKVSTQPYIYNKHILSNMMEPEAYSQLHYNNQIQVIQNENVGSFTYVSIYVPIRDANGQAYAYLNIPYINSQSELNQEISNFLVTLINLNAFIFVLAGLIALLLTNRITNSFSLIADKMKAINLGKFNEEISWNVNDEIGALVNEYNKMVQKLEQSAQALAKSEREGAWREMARQVAHEIKNPLTPMKLSIQYLQRSINEEKPGVQELAKKVSATLIEQIDQLAKIASDFSQFANIGNVKTEVFEVSSVVSSLINLHSANERVEIIWEKNAGPAFINADKAQINRLFTNLIQNAIEASVDNEKAIITIKEEIKNNQLLISVNDEGMGIPLNQHHRIFVPNFTTKTSGTGLGLAICKGIVEKAFGKIWFTTEENKGTTFYVQLPLADQ